MASYKKKYLKHFGYGEQDFVPSENSGKPAHDIHHLLFKSLGGTDDIENLMALTREEHDRAHNDPEYNEYLKHIHHKRLLQLKVKIHNG